jgi:hypothetical protein
MLALEKMSPKKSAFDIGTLHENADGNTFPKMGHGTHWGSVTSLDGSIAVK